MPIKTDPRHVGRASITPAEPVVAGQLGTWTITYEVGAYGYDEFARLKIASRFASDWGIPQFTDPAGANYASVRLEYPVPHDDRDALVGATRIHPALVQVPGGVDSGRVALSRGQDPRHDR